MNHWIRVIALLAFVCVRPAVAAGPAFERWYIVEIDGQKAGWAREAEEPAESNTIASTSELHFKFQRMGQDSEVTVVTRYVESAAGDLLEMSTTQTLGTEQVNETYTFIRGIAAYEVRHVTQTVGGKKEETLAWPEGDWISPGAARKLVEQRLAEGADTITYSSLDPSAGLTVVTLTQRITNRDAVVEAAGKTVPAVEWEVTNSLMPGIVGRDFVDARGVPLRSELNFGGMKMVMLASEKEAAQSEFSPPEMMAKTLVKPEGKEIPNARGVKRGVYILSMTDGSDMPDLPSVGAQVAERIDAKRVRITVVRGRMSEEPAAEDRRDDPALRPSTMITSNDKWVRDLARRAGIALVNEDDEKFSDSLTRSLMLMGVACVRRHIDEETLGVGFATAAEVARTGRGDCTEHAVLLAAIFRAAGAPTRVVSGLVHVQDGKGNGVFGYHMWVQSRALLEPPSWLDVDAAIVPTSTPLKGLGIDATHIALSTSTMADGDMINSMASLVGLLGRLKIEVVTVE